MTQVGLRWALTFIVFAGALHADTAICACDPAKPETLQARSCSLCREAEKQPLDARVFFLKDTNPTKPNRLLALPRVHTAGGHPLSSLSPAQRTELWQASIEKAIAVWGEDWGIAYNGDERRTQCHGHLHIGKLLVGTENDKFTVANSAAEIPVPVGAGMWVHPVVIDGAKRLHVHMGEQVTEFYLMR